MGISFMGMNFSNPDSFLRWYFQTFSQLAPTVKAPTTADPNKVIEGVRPVLQAEERGAQQRAASQFAKLGMPVSSAYMERLGRIGGETAAKMADITNRYAFEAAQKQAELEMQAALANQRAQMEVLGGLSGLLSQMLSGQFSGGQQGGQLSGQRQCETACANYASNDPMCYAACQRGDLATAQQIIAQKRRTMPGGECQSVCQGLTGGDHALCMMNCASGETAYLQKLADLRAKEEWKRQCNELCLGFAGQERTLCKMRCEAGDTGYAQEQYEKRSQR